MKEIKKTLDERVELRKYLYGKGFLITDDDKISLEGYPLYGNWKKTQIFDTGYFSYVHFENNIYLFNGEDASYFLIGHAYNPYTMEKDEDNILRTLSGYSSFDEKERYIDELTGIFILGMIKDGNITFLLDASGMQYGCYGRIGGKVYIASHMRLLGDFYELKTDDYVKRLTSYRWYRYMMGSYLPGDITCYREFKRIIPNTRVTFKRKDKSFSVQRFYPKKRIRMCRNEAEYQEVIKEGADILKNTMTLISEKWERPAISLTGGIDSNTTFAAANGNYDKFTTFSYISMYRESVDAKSAKEISKRFNVPWKSYKVPDNNEDTEDFLIFKMIFDRNDGDIGHYSDSDIRKKITLIKNDVCDVEVKSWISETIRAYAYKYFGRRSFPKNLSERNYTSLYKIFVLNRRLARETDGYFKEYLENTDLKAHLFNYDETDFFVWEMEHGGKCGGDIGVMKCCFDITIPYNNRKWLDTMLRVPLKRRIEDRHHLDMKKLLNKELYDMNIRIINLNETDRRKKLANMYFTINSVLP